MAPFRVTSVSDLAGQVTASSFNADHTSIAAVYLPTGALSSIRNRIPTGLPKWRDADDSDLNRVVDLLCREALSVGLGSVDKTTSQWGEFWKDAHDAHSAASSIEGGAIGFMKAATLIKFILFGYAAAAGLGHGILTRRIGIVRRRGKLIEVDEDLILDNEIQGDDNRDALVSVWRAVNQNQFWSQSAGVNRRAKTLSLFTEQREPLLLLADYVAGLQQATVSKANVLSRSKVTAPAVAKAIDRLRSNGLTSDFTGSVQLNYFDIYPDFKQFSSRQNAANPAARTSPSKQPLKRSD